MHVHVQCNSTYVYVYASPCTCIGCEINRTGTGDNVDTLHCLFDERIPENNS